MIDVAMLGETQTRRDLVQLLRTAVQLSGRNRREIAREAEIHQDALRILAAAGMSPHAQLLLLLGAGGYPKTIRVDNGSEFISRDMDLWAYQRGVILDFSRPG